MAPYAWFVSLEGDVTVKGRKSEIDMDFSDIWDEMNIGVMIAFEAGNGRWGILSNVIYANLGQDTTTLPEPGDLQPSDSWTLPE